MIVYGVNRRWMVLISAGLFLLTCSYLVWSPPPAAKQVKEKITEIAKKIPFPGLKDPNAALFKLQYDARDSHPISILISEADKRFHGYEESISSTFQETVAKYRRNYGRHPPPGFAEWYKFARERDVHNIDDFDQIMGDLRPFWAVPAATLRSEAAHLWEENRDVNALHIRSGNVVKTGLTNWRLEAYTEMLQSFVSKLPDMDIAINGMDQPRVISPWEELQKALNAEHKSRKVYPETTNSFTTGMNGFTKWELDQDKKFRNTSRWYDGKGKPFLDLVKPACPPDSFANGGSASEEHWKSNPSGIITNYNLSTDLCTIGPNLHLLHSFMIAPTALSVTRNLIPIFGESKTSVNNDILIPAAMYWRNDTWGSYDVSNDIRWEEKKNKFYWRGMTSGLSTKENWLFQHRSRLVSILNETFVEEGESKILGLSSLTNGVYDMASLKTAQFLQNHSDVGFIETDECSPEDCAFYHEKLTMIPQERPGEQFHNKFLIDVDGNGFSGKWRAILRSRSLVLKASIFREWHDSRLFAWRHFVPMDNRFDDILSILTYFIGVGDPAVAPTIGSPLVPQHEFEAKRLALQGREWSRKVLRKEDIEVYVYRLLLEYGRLIDDNRDRIGYSGSGSEVDDGLGLKDLYKQSKHGG